MNGFVFGKLNLKDRCFRRSGLVVTHVIAGFLLLSGILIFSGCDNQPQASNLDDSNVNQAAEDTGPKWVEDRRTARDIVAGVLDQYAFAQSYSDNAVLYLSYRMDGRAIQEPQPWAISWTKDGQFAGDVFNSRIRCDGKVLDCYVFDIETGNLDNQKVVMLANGMIPINELFSDPIAKRFLGGYSELPLDEKRNTQIAALTPPQFWLLTDATKLPWLKRADRLKRLPDVEVDGNRCYVIRAFKDGEQYDLWIEHESNIVLQVAYPTTLLEEQVRTSPEIQDLCLVVRFHDAQLNQPIQSETFALQNRPTAKPVRNFVRLPEPLPTELIGKSAKSLQFNRPTGEGVTDTDLRGRATALFWMAGGMSKDALGQFVALSEQLDSAEYNFAIVYSDAELKDPASGSFAPVDTVQSLANGTNLKLLYDKGLATSSQLRIKAIPTIVVLDEKLKIQFARALSDEKWITDVTAAMKRVQSGDDVASEMLAEYQRYLAAYHAKLTANSSAHLLEVQTPIQNASTKGVTLQRKMRVQKEWARKNLQMPGNVYRVEREDQISLYTFDGWRTVVELNTRGETVRKHVLEFPENEGASLLRQFRQKNGKSFFAAFAPLGKTICIFDENFKKISSFPIEESEDVKIRDCQFMASSSGAPSLLISAIGLDGLTQLDLQTGVSKVVISRQFDALDRTALLGTSQGELIRLEQFDVVSGLEDWNLKRVLTSENKKTCALASTDDGTWYSIGLGFGQDQNWSLSIGSQLFESNIESLTFVDRQNETIWAVADSDGSIQIMSDTGRWLGDMEVESELRGLALFVENGDLKLVVSTVASVECWNLDLGGFGTR